MDEILTVCGSFVHGIPFEGKVYRDFTLEEEVMRHTFQVSNDPHLDLERLAGGKPDAAYYSACIMAARLQVEGLPRVSPEQVERLSKEDCRMLLVLSANLESRREHFRKEAEAPEKRHPGHEEARLYHGRGAEDEPGDRQGV